MTTDRNRVIVLDRVHRALGVKGDERARRQAVADRLHSHPRGTIPARARAGREALRQLFETMLKGQGSEIVHAATPVDAVRAIAADLRAHNLRPVLRMGADPLLAALPWQDIPAIELQLGRAGPEDQVALSRAVVGAAETGTLFLVSGADNPTSLAFLPEQHIILIRFQDIVGAYEEAFDLLREIYGEGALPRCVNMISGPSRTADIEQTIVRGAHGPKRLLVVILG